MLDITVVDIKTSFLGIFKDPFTKFDVLPSASLNVQIVVSRYGFVYCSYMQIVNMQM